METNNINKYIVHMDFECKTRQSLGIHGSDYYQNNLTM